MRSSDVLRRGFSPVLAVLLVATIGACSGDADRAPARVVSPPADDGGEGPPPLVQVGSAADLWVFPFTMSADRDEVRDAFGEPVERESRRDDGRTSGPEALVWEYPGLTVTFLAGTSDGDDYLISVRVTDPSVALGSGIAVGMPADDALTILGEPRVRDGRSLVYFYRASTIELVVDAGLVVEVVLARALP